MNDDTSHYEGALLEEIRDQSKAILEMLSGFRGMPTKVDNIDTIVERIDQTISQ